MLLGCAHQLRYLEPDGTTLLQPTAKGDINPPSKYPACNTFSLLRSKERFALRLSCRSTEVDTWSPSVSRLSAVVLQLHPVYAVHGVLPLVLCTFMVAVTRVLDRRSDVC